MPVYRGVVQGAVVVLTDPVDLADGTVVEVRPVAPAPEAVPDELDVKEREAAFKRYLLSTGVISSLPTHEPDPLGMDRTPVELTLGPLASELVIEERR